MKSIAPVAAVANFKGGVGKSTTALMLADGLAWYYGLNVIVYDFDAQANLSQLLLTGEGVQRALNCEHGITPILETFAPNDPRPISDTHRALDTVRACAIEELVKNRDKTGSSEGWISLLPAHPHMRFLEPWLERSPGPGWYDVGDAIVGRVNEATLAEREAADIVIIDCPPHVSALCRAALKMADVYVTPTLPEALSIWGVTQFAKWMTHAEMQEWLHLTRDEFAARQFVVATRLVRASATQRRALEGLKQEWPGRTFSSPISHRASLSKELPRANTEAVKSMGGRYQGQLKIDVSRLADDFVDYAHRMFGVNWERKRDLLLQRRHNLFEPAA